MAVAVALLTAAVAVLAVLVLGLLRSHAEILRALHELGVSIDPDRDDGPRVVEGLPQPRRRAGAGHERGRDLAGLTPAGDAAHVGIVGAEHRTLLAFLTSGCLTCRGFWEAFAEGVELDDARLVVVTKGPAGESPSAVAGLAPAGVTTLMSDEAWEAYGVEVAPYFVLVDGATGAVVGEGAATRWSQVHRLMDQANRDVEGSGLARAEEALRAAGIGPDHPSLHHLTTGAEPAAEAND